MHAGEQSIISIKQTTTMATTVMEEERRANIGWPTCSICYFEYSADHIPIQLICCGNTLCLDCFQKCQAEELSKLDDVNDIWYSCPISKCRLSKNTGYNRSNKCYEKNRLLMDILGIDPAFSSTVANPNPNIARPGNSSAGENDVSSAAAGAGRETEDAENEVIDLLHQDEDDDSPDEQTNNQSVTNLRRSQRTRRSVSRDIAGDTTAARDEIIQRPKRPRRADASEVVADVVRVSERSRRVNRRIAHSNERQTDSLTEGREDPSVGISISVSSPCAVAANQLWKQEISKEEVNVYRIRCYNTESDANDKYGRGMSQWCVNNGITITCLELAKILPRHQWWDAEALRDRVVSVNHQELRQICRESQHYPQNEMPYVRSYKEFVEMKKGDIVVLHTKGGYTKSGPPQTLTFGVIQDDSLITMNREEMKQKNCPWDLMNYGEQTTSRIGLMVKKVKWLRQGELKAVRGAHQVNWLAEAQPLWLMRVGAAERKFLTQAIKKMGSKQFIQNTRVIDNQWTMG